MRKTTLLSLLLAVLCGIGIFHTSQRVHDEREKIAELNAAIAKEEETLRVLNTEWSYLNQPARLEKLAKTYLKLTPLKGGQFVKAEDVPLRGVAEAKAEEAAAPVAAVKKTEEKKAAETKITEKKTIEKKIAEKKAPENKSPVPQPMTAEIKKRPLAQPIPDSKPENTSAPAKAGVKAASTHTFADLMKNLKVGIE